MRADKGFGIIHSFHSKTAADIRVRHPHLLWGKFQHFRQTRFGRPHALTIDRNVQPIFFPFGKTAARLDRGYDNPIIRNIQSDAMRRRFKHCLGGGLITHTPVKSDIIWRLFMQRLATGLQCQMNR